VRQRAGPSQAESKESGSLGGKRITGAHRPGVSGVYRLTGLAEQSGIQRADVKTQRRKERELQRQRMPRHQYCRSDLLAALLTRVTTLLVNLSQTEPQAGWNPRGPARSKPGVVSRMILDKNIPWRPHLPARYARHPLPQGGKGIVKNYAGRDTRFRKPDPAALGRSRKPLEQGLIWMAALLLAVVLIPLGARGQSASTPAPQTSPNQSNAATQSNAQTQANPPSVIAFAELQGSYNRPGIVGMLDIDAGYVFSDHISADVGVPLVLTRSPFSPVLNRDYYWSGALGEPYVDVRYTRSLKSEATLTSILTGTIPVGNEEVTFTTGRAGVDWFNHIEEKWGLLTPFVNIEASNGAVNRFVMPRPFEEARPFESLGFLSDFEAGSSLKLPWLLKGASLGASAYAVVPVGPQKIFSRLVLPYSALGDLSEGSLHHYRLWDQTFETTGYAGACPECGVPKDTKGVRDNGYSGWLDVARFQPFDLQLGYTHSVHYGLDTYTVTLTFDGRNLVKKITGY
jgi:hypothetical protein